MDRLAVPDGRGDDQVQAEQGQPFEPGRLAVEHDERGEQRGQCHGGQQQRRQDERQPAADEEADEDEGGRQRDRDLDASC